MNEAKAVQPGIVDFGEAAARQPRGCTTLLRDGFDWVRFGSVSRAFPFIFNKLVASFLHF
jgi:hypothetical protein